MWRSYSECQLKTCWCHCRVPEEGPAEVVQLMDACMNDDPNKRPKAKDIINTLQDIAAKYNSYGDAMS